MEFSTLASYLSCLEETASRNRMTEILSALFKKAKPEEIDKVCYLSLGRLAPLYQSVEFNIAEKLMMKVLAQAYRKEEKEIRQKYKKLGDLGDVAAFYDYKEASKPLSVNQVYERLLEIAQENGAGSVERKITKMAKLLQDLDKQSAKFIVRIPLGKLRLGFSDKTILDALSWMQVGDKSKKDEIEKVYNVRADVGQIAKRIKKQGLEGLEKIKVKIGVPIIPALCQRLPTAEKMIKKMCRSEVGHSRFKGSGSKVASEPKYDGTRLQVHFSRNKKWESRDNQLTFDFQPAGLVRTFTRNLEDNTHMFPDLVKTIFEEVKADEAILDCEAVGYDPQSGKLLPFQQTMKRKRKHGISQTAQEIPLRFYCFDILYKDGRSLLKKTFKKRREILEQIILSSAETIVISPQIVTDNPEDLRSFHQEQIDEGLEGTVVKKWQASYDPGKRGYTWVKYKQEEGKKGGGLADTLDCVVMGYYQGRGKRAEFGIGMILVGIQSSEEEDQFLSITKVGTGPSDQQWVKMRKRCDELKTGKKPKQYQVDKNLFPDVWCQPGIVVEVEADNITQSPVHLAGYSLRFPRWLRFRDDKNPSQATTLAETKRLYKLQK